MILRNIARLGLACSIDCSLMNTITEIEQALQQLSTEELAKFREWFAEFDAEAWDRQFETDAAAGRLDALGDEALRDLDEGRCRDL